MSTKSETLREVPYTFASRFEGGKGACPEELLAAAHAGCFNQALANISGIHGLTVETVHTSAGVTMGRDDRGPAILGVHLTVTANVPGATDEKFQDLAERARVECAFSKVLAIDITMKARLTS
jgi:osmotically inducible protein OsmC